MLATSNLIAAATGSICRQYLESMTFGSQLPSSKGRAPSRACMLSYAHPLALMLGRKQHSSTPTLLRYVRQLMHVLKGFANLHQCIDTSTSQLLHVSTNCVRKMCSLCVCHLICLICLQDPSFEQSTASWMLQGNAIVSASSTSSNNAPLKLGEGSYIWQALWNQARLQVNASCMLNADASRCAVAELLAVP